MLAGELASRFGVSEDTVRRDLRELAKAGQCRRVYGGAVASAPFAAAPLGLRSGHAVEEKTRLASAAVALLAARTDACSSTAARPTPRSPAPSRATSS